VVQRSTERCGYGSTATFSGGVEMAGRGCGARGSVAADGTGHAGRGENVSDDTGAADARGGLVLILVILGAGLMAAGVWILADRYSADYDCLNELTCHDDGGLSPTPADRATAAMGFGLVHANASGDPLPGPEGTLLVVAGVVVLIGAVLVGPRRRRSGADVAASPQPMSTAYQLERYERLHARGTLTDEELAQRKARLVGPG
jgi:hypothetical protein